MQAGLCFIPTTGVQNSAFAWDVGFIPLIPIAADSRFVDDHVVKLSKNGEIVKPIEIWYLKFTTAIKGQQQL